jgi:hypothetical protein
MLTEAFIDPTEFDEFLTVAEEADSERGDLQSDLLHIAFLAMIGSPKLKPAVAALRKDLVARNEAIKSYGWA